MFNSKPKGTFKMSVDLIGKVGKVRDTKKGFDVTLVFPESGLEDMKIKYEGKDAESMCEFVRVGQTAVATCHLDNIMTRRGVFKGKIVVDKMQYAMA